MSESKVSEQQPSNILSKDNLSQNELQINESQTIVYENNGVQVSQD